MTALASTSASLLAAATAAAMQPRTTVQLALVAAFGLAYLTILVVVLPWAQHRFGPEARVATEVRQLLDAGLEHHHIVDILYCTHPTADPDGRVP